MREIDVYVLFRNNEPMTYQNFVYTDEDYCKGLVKQYKENIVEKGNKIEYKKARLILSE